MATDQKALFKERAERILDFLNTKQRYNQLLIPPPFFIEFLGSASSGKSSTIKLIYNFLRRNGFEVLMPQEGAEVFPSNWRKNPDYNIQTGMYALGILLRERKRHNYDFVLFDRCIFDAYHWMMYWYEKERLTKEQRQHWQAIFLDPLFSPDIKLAFIMTCEPNVALARENEHALTDDLGETTNPQAIAKTIERHRTMYDALILHNPQLRLVDTTTTSRKEVAGRIGAEILKILDPLEK
ncbi:MAG: hypothetical protein Q8R36_00130 [bacterium]|nr:hypothetical protein [bacterium]